MVRARSDERPLDLLRWGLQPPWLDKPAPVNARAETVATLPMFRSAFKARRCVPVSGFDEWQAGPEGANKAKQPWYICRADGAPLLFAGLWELKDDLQTITVVTTAANDFMKALHDRMPVVLEPETARRWVEEPDASLLVPAADGVLTAHRVSTRVNSPKNDDRSLIEGAPERPSDQSEQPSLW